MLIIKKLEIEIFFRRDFLLGRQELQHITSSKSSKLTEHIYKGFFNIAEIFIESN